MLASCSSTENYGQGNICNVKLNVATTFLPGSKYFGKVTYFNELFKSQLEIELPHSNTSVIGSQDPSDFEIKILKAYGTRRSTSIAGNIIIELIDMSSGESEIFRGIEVSNTYWVSRSENDAISMAMANVISKIKPKINNFCGIYSFQQKHSDFPTVGLM